MTNPADEQYLRTLADLLLKGAQRIGRSGTTFGLFGHQMRIDLAKGFPLLTTKRVHFKSVAVELLWFLRGDTNTKYLNDYGVTIWDEWADENGDLGPVYGKQWRSWWDNPMGESSARKIDQIQRVIDNLRSDPYGRRHVVTAWNPAEVDDMALPPCHCLFQFFVADGRLSCHLYQRSADWFLGVPFNIASYALLTHLVAREVGLCVGDFVHSFGDLHLYENHVEQALEQIGRVPRALPLIDIVGDRGIFDLTLEDIRLVGYDPHPAIKAEVSA